MVSAGMNMVFVDAEMVILFTASKIHATVWRQYVPDAHRTVLLLTTGVSAARLEPLTCYHN